MHATVELADIAADVLARIRDRVPSVHCITNSVAQQYTANVLLAVGAVPSMTISPEEIVSFVAGADALLVNLGTFDAERRSAIEAAIGAAKTARMPWVLDPVFIQVAPARAHFARQLLTRGPAVVRLNTVEFATLSDDDAGDAAARLAKAHGTVIALTGGVDRITDGGRHAIIANGDPLMKSRHRHGLRRLGGGVCRARRGTRSLPCRHRGVDLFRRCRRGGGTRRARARQFLDRDHRRAPFARQRDVAAVREGVVTPVDLRLNAIIDPEHAGGHDLVALARHVAEGGATLVQLRDKRSDTQAMVEGGARDKGGARAVTECRSSSTTASTWRSRRMPMACMSARTIWRWRTRGARSDRTPSSASRSRRSTRRQAAPLALIDYAGVGGVYATGSKVQKSAPIGTAGLARVAAALRRRKPDFPVVGIAGIDAGNAGAVIAAGADGVAVISALSIA